MPLLQLPAFKMHYVEQGDGEETIVFVHGFVSSHRWWLPTLAALPRSYRALALDLRSCGESEKIATGHRLDQYVADIEAFATAKALERFTLVGHSMGGGLAMGYAIKYPERVKGLVLVDPMAPYGMRIDQATTDWLNAAQGQERALRSVVLGAFATPPTGKYLEQLVADAVAWDSVIYHSVMDEMAAFDVSAQLGGLEVPTLVTWGDKDSVIPFEGIVTTYGSIPHCSLEIWHGVGHSGPIEIPERFVSLLTGFIAESSQAQG